MLGDPALPHLFFVEGGALAVENALKCAFDWKSRRNEARAAPRRWGPQVLHLTRAFHGRSGYTLSLTNTDPVKTDRFPKFDWPRIDVAGHHLPARASTWRRSRRPRRVRWPRPRRPSAAHPHDIACFIAEPIQAEGGDNHMRPSSCRRCSSCASDNDALFVLDEVQTGVGITGTPWAYQQLGLEPDIVAFGKKVQLGGIMAGRRVDEVPDNVFTGVSGRINSTWGGASPTWSAPAGCWRSSSATGCSTNAASRRGTGSSRAAKSSREPYPGLVANARGRGLMCAIDLPDARQLATTLVTACGRTSTCSCCRAASARSASARR